MKVYQLFESRGCTVEEAKARIRQNFEVTDEETHHIIIKVGKNLVRDKVRYAGKTDEGEYFDEIRFYFQEADTLDYKALHSSPHKLKTSSSEPIISEIFLDTKSSAIRTYHLTEFEINNPEDIDHMISFVKKAYM